MFEITNQECLMIDFHAMNYSFHYKEFLPLDEKFEVTELTNQTKTTCLGEFKT